MSRLFICLAFMIALSACSVPDPEVDPQIELGDFQLKDNVAVTKNARKLGVSRDATAQEWEESLEAAVDARFRRYAGATPYTISYSLDGYILATKAGRLALAPRSAMSMTVHIWQTDPLVRLKDRSKQLLIFEGLDGETVIGSGLFRTKEEQMENLSAQFAKAVERWLRANSDLFGVDVSEEALAAAAQDDAAQIAAEAAASADPDTASTTGPTPDPTTRPIRPVPRPTEG